MHNLPALDSSSKSFACRSPFMQSVFSSIVAGSADSMEDMPEKWSHIRLPDSSIRPEFYSSVDQLINVYQCKSISIHQYIYTATQQMHIEAPPAQCFQPAEGSCRLHGYMGTWQHGYLPNYMPTHLQSYMWLMVCGL